MATRIRRVFNSELQVLTVANAVDYLAVGDVVVITKRTRKTTQTATKVKVSCGFLIGLFSARLTVSTLGLYELTSVTSIISLLEPTNVEISGLATGGFFLRGKRGLDELVNCFKEVVKRRIITLTAVSDLTITAQTAAVISHIYDEIHANTVTTLTHEVRSVTVIITMSVDD